jgi:hypothetical protein
VIEDGKVFDRLTMLAGDGIAQDAVRVINVSHGDSEGCLDENNVQSRDKDFSPFVRISALDEPRESLIGSLISRAFAQSKQNPDFADLKGYLDSPDPQLRDYAVQTIAANPGAYAQQINATIANSSAEDESIATVILAAKNAQPAIKLDTAMLIDLSYNGGGKVRDAARSYLRNVNIVDEAIAQQIQSAVDAKRVALRSQPVPGSSFGRDYLLLVAARDVYYNLGLRRLDEYRVAVREGGKGDLGPVLDAFDKGRKLRELAANAEQRIALAKNTYGKAYALYVAAMNTQAVEQGKGQPPDDFVDDAMKRNEKLVDPSATEVFQHFLQEIANAPDLYPWPAHIAQAERCAKSLTFGCLEERKSAN